MRSLNIGVIVGSGIFVAIGLFAIGAGWRNVARGLASREWPTARGVVVRAETETSTSRDPETRRTSTTYSTKTLVRYRAGNRDLETSTRRFGQLEGSGDASDAALERLRYPEGADVKVWYDPAEPTIATLHPGTRAEAFLLPLAGLAFLAGAMMIALAGRGARNDGGMSGVLTFFCVTFCAIGAAMIAPGVLNLLRARESVRWPTTQGTIVFGTPPYGDSTLDTRIAEGELEVAPSDERLVYRYEVRGQAHYGNVHRFGQLAGTSEDGASAIASRFPLGSETEVHYSAARPDLAVLEPGIAAEAYVLPAAGLAFVLFGLAGLRWAVPTLGG